YEVAQAVGIALALLGELDDEFGDHHCERSFTIGEIQCTQRVIECAEKNLYVFRTEGVVVLKKVTNRHGGLPSATYTTGLAIGSPTNGHKYDSLVKGRSFGALALRPRPA